MKRKLKPVLEGDWWLIGPSPDLKGILPGADTWQGHPSGEHNAPVDHHMFQDPQGTWHLWGCVRATAVGRILYHWRGDDFRTSPLECTGEYIRVDREAGESYGSSPGEGANHREECIQSPFFLKHDGRFCMFYGGGAARPTDPDQPRSAQMCLMTSEDGIHWTRHRNAEGLSRVFVGPGPTRDPVVLRIDGRWAMYYAGTRNGNLDDPVFWARTSDNLLDWSEPVCVHQDLNYGAGRWDTECPFVTFRDGYYYLFRTEDYYKAMTHVFRSEDPFDFGVGDAKPYYVGRFPAAAPELYEIDGAEYVTSNHNPPLGTQMARMKWTEDA